MEKSLYNSADGGAFHRLAASDARPVLNYHPRLARRPPQVESVDVAVTVLCAMIILLCVSLIVTLRIVHGQWG